MQNSFDITVPQWHLLGIIDQASVFVDMDRTAGDTLEQRYIIHHEMMHALGFFGHAILHDTYNVLFYQTIIPFVVDYTYFDKRMMLLLYNPSIRAGMNEDEFNEVIKNL